MYALDFEYDNQYLSDYNFIICDFDYSNGSKTANAGSKITFEKVTRNNGESNTLVNTKYEECLQATFAICKNPDFYDSYEDRMITNDEFRDLMRWLNRRQFFKFRFVLEDNETCFYNASFNIETVKIAERLVGLQLTMETDKPFGYGEEFKKKYSFDSTHTSKKLSDVSDEIGYIYPNVTIKFLEDVANFTLSNVEQDTTVSIANCTNGEIITMQGAEKIISTSVNAHNICNDFNYTFLKIGNTLDNSTNTLQCSAECEVTISYHPIIKNPL